MKRELECCPNCGEKLGGCLQPICPKCRTLLPKYFQPATKDTCGNCHEPLEPGDKYCRYCGTKVGDGAYNPFQDLMECIYGPMPVDREHACTVCGFSWTTRLMIDDQKFCPKCGGLAMKIPNFRDPW